MTPTTDDWRDPGEGDIRPADMERVVRILRHDLVNVKTVANGNMEVLRDMAVDMRTARDKATVAAEQFAQLTADLYGDSRRGRSDDGGSFGRVSAEILDVRNEVKALRRLGYGIMGTLITTLGALIVDLFVRLGAPHP